MGEQTIDLTGSTGMSAGLCHCVLVDGWAHPDLSTTGSVCWQLIGATVMVLETVIADLSVATAFYAQY